MKEIKLKLKFKESKMSSSYELFHKVVENFILFKWMFFKNRPRTSFLLVRSLLVNTLVFGAYYAIFSNINFIFMGVEIEPLLLFAGSISVSYWVMSWSFSQKANYLSTLYNDIIKHQVKDQETAKMLACSFSAQLLTMDMWGHRLYSRTFTQTLLESAKWSLTHQKKYSEFKNLNEFIDFINAGKLEVGIARSMLLDYQQSISSQFEPSQDFTLLKSAQ